MTAAGLLALEQVVLQSLSASWETFSPIKLRIVVFATAQEITDILEALPGLKIVSDRVSSSAQIEEKNMTRAKCTAERTDLIKISPVHLIHRATLWMFLYLEILFNTINWWEKQSLPDDKNLFQLVRFITRILYCD